ncbi:MAG: TonB family protein [Candidatus Eisenbacteria bacterium]|nr:TonB family protein [Candidatus Eisenbacteria bacterium]
MKRFLLFALLAGTIATAGCAYYNTLYHANQFYEEAERSRRNVAPEKRESVGLDLYEKAMRKCAKVIIEYPDSRWVDDAILLMGKCFYAKGDYLAALRKFDEILNYYPNSNLVRQARFQKARTLVAMERYAEAVPVLEVFREGGKKELRKEALYLLALVEHRLGRYEKAAEGFEAYLELTDGGERRDEVLGLLGRSYARSGKWRESYEAYARQLNNPLLDEKVRLESSLAMADALAREGRYDEAYETLEETRAEVRTRADTLRIELQEARSMLGEGRLEEAVDSLRAALVEAPSSEPAGEIAYLLGELYLNELDNKDSAAAAFRLVGQHPVEEEKKNEAARVSRNLSEYIRLERAYEEEAADTAEIEFLLAESEFFFFRKPEGARRRYRFVTERFPDSPYAPRALAARVYLSRHGFTEEPNEDSLMLRAVRGYPRSFTARELVDRGEVAPPAESLEVWIALWDEAHPPEDTAAVETTAVAMIVEEGDDVPTAMRSATRWEGELRFEGPPAPLRIQTRVEPEKPLLAEEDEPVRGTVEVEVDVNGEGRVFEARIVRSDNPVLNGPALAAAFQCRYIPEPIDEIRSTNLVYTFR